jgi:hypothetical protein
MTDEPFDYENHPTTDDGEFVQPVRESYVHDECGTVTAMGSKLAESFARDPTQYDKTFCAGCGDYYDLDEFVWNGTDIPVDTVGQGDYELGVVDALDGLLRETAHTTTQEDILLAAFDSARIPSELVSRARDRLRDDDGE